ncbi:MAG: ATP phosphoribosyltransferase regulatory subunit [Firmicutes bacterium]|nr:ATP phosphoribosyltransferase regulatory subunit [Bacillota bacterium]
MAYTMMQTPRGTKDFLPRNAERKRWMEAVLVGLFRQWGYREIITPTMEFYDAVSAGDVTGLARNLYRFFEREGDLLALRPDVTTPVARVVATRLQDTPKPLRLCYHANVFRYAEPQAGRRREFYQAGVELVGSSSYLADAEVVALTVEALRAVGLKNFRVDIGQVDYYDGILQHPALSPGQRRSMRLALLKKDYVALNELLSDCNLPREDRELLRQLPELRGGGEILEEAMERATNLISKQAIEHLMAVYEVLEAYDLANWVRVDLGMIKDIEYYTGMVLEAYTADMGFTIGTGGRYDNLIHQFGYDCPATGFALGIERIMLALSRQQGWPTMPNRRILCMKTAKQPGLSWQVARKLREYGYTVELDVGKRSQAETEEYAEASGFRWLVCPLSLEQIRIWSPKAGWRELELAQFVAAIEEESISE